MTKSAVVFYVESGEISKEVYDALGVKNNKLGECPCKCHTPTSEIKMMHSMPCCNTCPYCKKNIVLGKIESHIEKCKKERGV